MASILFLTVVFVVAVSYAYPIPPWLKPALKDPTVAEWLQASESVKLATAGSEILNRAILDAVPTEYRPYKTEAQLKASAERLKQCIDRSLASEASEEMSTAVKFCLRR